VRVAATGRLRNAGLVVNERLVCGGRVPDQAEVVTFETAALGGPSGGQ
jgi:hypothetical protein